MNLSWKIAGVLSGNLPQPVLDTYEQERKPHARAMIRLAKLVGVSMTQGGRAGDVLRKLIAPRLHWIPGLRDRLLDGETPPLHPSGLVEGRSHRSSLNGRLCPNALLADDIRYDDVTRGRVFVTRQPLAPQQRALLASRGTQVLEVQPGSPHYEWLADGKAAAALVRPDFTVLRVFPEHLRASPERYVLLTGSSTVPELLRAGALTAGVVVWSLWSGYLAEPSGVRLRAEVAGAGVRFVEHHTSGHAPLADLNASSRRSSPRGSCRSTPKAPSSTPATSPRSPHGRMAPGGPSDLDARRTMTPPSCGRPYGARAGVTDLETHKPGAPARSSRRLTAGRRRTVARMRLVYSLTDPLDAEAAESLSNEESWYIGVELDDAQVGRLAVHRVPLHNRRDLGWEADAGDDIPGHPVATVTDFDLPIADVLRRISDPDQALGQSFLVVDNVELPAAWQRLQLEPLLLSVVLEKLLTDDDSFAVA